MNDGRGEFQLFVEEICSKIVRADRLSAAPDKEVLVLREVPLGPEGAYADIKVLPEGEPSYFLEVKWGLPRSELVLRLSRKYGASPDPGATKLIVVSDLADGDEAEKLLAALNGAVCGSLELELWGERDLVEGLQRMGVRLDSIFTADYRDVRESISRAEWEFAFSGMPFDALSGTLLWHYSSWSLRKLNRHHHLQPRDILKPGEYHQVVILIADLCSFSSYVRDSRDNSLVRDSLTSFYSKSRQAVVDSGGMLDKFVGDEVIGIFGVPVSSPDDSVRALECARRLISVGNSVSHHWQRHLDRVQKQGGVKIGMAIGDLSLMPLRAYSATHVGFIGDAINITARLMATAAPSEIVISNGFSRALPPDLRDLFEEGTAVDAKNVGSIRCWRRQF